MSCATPRPLISARVRSPGLEPRLPGSLLSVLTALRYCMPQESRLVILVVEELGYGHWIWSPGLEARDLLAWFRGIDPTAGARGNRLLFMDLIGTFERVKNEDLPAFYDRFKDPAVWSAHIHMPDDSYIRTPQGERVRPWADPEVQDSFWQVRFEELDAICRRVEMAGTLDALGDIFSACPPPPRGYRGELDLHWQQLGTGLGEQLSRGPIHVFSTLDLTHNGLEDDDLVHLASRLQAEELTLADDALTDAGLVPIFALHTLRWLHLPEHSLGPAGIAALLQRPDRRSLVIEVDFSDVSDSDRQALIAKRIWLQQRNSSSS